MGFNRLLGLVGATFLASSAHAGEPADYAGIPITDPDWDPIVTGYGHEPVVLPALNSPTILFVNFDATMVNGGCGNDARNDCSTIFPSTPFNPYPGDASNRAAVIQATREDVEDFGVVVLGERPPSDQPYAMVIVGTPSGGAPPGVGGVAPGIDCGNVNPYITSFAFLVDSGANVLATVIHQEAAHTWGLEHVDASNDNLYPSAGGTLDPGYTDECHQVVADTNLNPTSAQCNSIHTLFCPSNMQNSYQEMLALFGPPIPDLIAPTISISSPTEGQEIDYAENFDLTFTIDDDRRPAIMDVIIYVDDVEITDAVLINQEHTFPVNGGDPPGGHGLPDGPHVLKVETIDEGGNPATDEVTFVIVNGPQAGDGTAGGSDATGGASDGGGGTAGGGGSDGGVDSGIGLDGGGDDGGDTGCSCRTTAPAWSGATLLLLLAGFRRRRLS